MKRSPAWTILVLIISLYPASCCHAEDLRPAMHTEAKRIVGGHRAVFASPPKQTPSRHAVDAPLLGNGDLGVAISGDPQSQRFWLCKNDFWQLRHGRGSGPRVFGGVDVTIPRLADASYRIEQSPYDGVTVGRFGKQDLVVTMRSWVAASENLLVVEISCQGGEVDGDAKLWVQSGSGSQTEQGNIGGSPWVVRKFVDDVDIPTEAAAASKLVGLDKMAFTAGPEKPVILVVAMQSAFKGESYLADVQKQIADLDNEKVRQLWRDHTTWWHNFWAQSLVEIPDKDVERHYYISTYVMGSCSRDPKFPPGIFGTWVTTDLPAWNGDYHLNYNHMAPYYALYSSNHIEQADPYHGPLFDFMPRAQFYAKSILGIRGPYMPVGIGPKGIETTRQLGTTPYGKPGVRNSRREDEGLFFGQKSNSAYAMVNLSARWYLTYDKAYAKEIYPFVSGVAAFWEDYLTFEDGRYVIYKDSIHEGSGENVNPILSLGLVRNVFETALDMSTEMGIDSDRHAKWKHILKHLSGYTTQEMKGLTVFRYTERGTAWWKNNTLGIQHIYPAGAIHLDSDPQLLELSHNTIEVMGRWIDGNGSNSFFPAAVRVGYDPKVIWEKLNEYVTRAASTNGWAKNNPHGIENCSVVPNTVNQMLCMGHKGVLRIFPVWPREHNAAFWDLRAEGAFLVSSELRDGIVQDVSIRSERGRDCTLVNPWPGKTVQVFRNGKPAETFADDRVTLKTAEGETLLLRPIKGAP